MKTEKDSAPGTLIYHPAGEEHTDYFDPKPAHCFSIEINPANFEGLNDSDKRLQNGIAVRVGPLVGLAAQVYRLFVRNELSRSAMEDGVFRLFGDAFFASHDIKTGHIPKWLQTAREIIKYDFRSDLSLTSIAVKVGVHPVHLSRTYRQAYGRTISATILQSRIEYACRVLSVEKEDLGSIAHAAGFADQSHFTREFKRIIGMTPGDFRNAMRGK